MSDNGIDHIHPEVPVDGDGHVTAEDLNKYNCGVLSSAIEDMHHQNLARMALLQTNAGITVAEADLLGIKFELLLDLLVEGNLLRRLQVGFAFQGQLAKHLRALEATTKKE